MTEKTSVKFAELPFLEKAAFLAEQCGPQGILFADKTFISITPEIELPPPRKGRQRKKGAKLVGYAIEMTPAGDPENSCFFAHVSIPDGLNYCRTVINNQKRILNPEDIPEKSQAANKLFDWIHQLINQKQFSLETIPSEIWP